MKTCECKTVNGDDANFCASCGRRLPETAPASDSELAPARARIQQQRALRIVAAFIAIVLVVAVSLTFLLRNVHIDINPSKVVSAQLSLNVCKTTVGDPSEKAVKLPTTLRAKIPNGDGSKLAFYADDQGLIEVMAPVGWKCSAGIGANGSSSVYVAPASGPNSAGSTLEAISASQTSACVGCRESLACPLFASAAYAYLKTYVQMCPTKRAALERVTRIGAHVVEYVDPPGVNGDASPSGGAYPARGVMTYYGNRDSDGSWSETCVLPPADASMCKAVTANFKFRYGSL